MSRKEVDQSLVQAAYIFINAGEHGHDQILSQQFKKRVQFFREPGRKLPWDTWEDPGAGYEYQTHLKYHTGVNPRRILEEGLDVKGKVDPHDIRLLWVQESLREACHLVRRRA
jgi:hypothetical protein